MCIINMDNKDRIMLDKLIRNNNVEDMTSIIREKKHSKLIKEDVTTLLELKKKYQRLSNEQFDRIAVSKCSFLFNNYTTIFNKVKKDEVDLQILWNFLVILQRIEDGELTQHEGSYQVGKILKELYIDSALKKANKINGKRTGKKEKKMGPKNISWKQFKMIQEE